MENKFESLEDCEKTCLGTTTKQALSTKATQTTAKNPATKMVNGPLPGSAEPVKVETTTTNSAGSNVVIAFSGMLFINVLAVLNI